MDSQPEIGLNPNNSVIKRLWLYEHFDISRKKSSKENLLNLFNIPSTGFTSYRAWSVILFLGKPHDEGSLPVLRTHSFVNFVLML